MLVVVFLPEVLPPLVLVSFSFTVVLASATLPETFLFPALLALLEVPDEVVEEALEAGLLVEVVVFCSALVVEEVD